MNIQRQRFGGDWTEQKNWKSHRALVFLDPYGMQVEWKTIKSIAVTQAIDLWILFPLGTVNRLLKNDGEIRSSLRARLDIFLVNPIGTRCSIN